MWKCCLKPSGDTLGALPNLRELRLARSQPCTLPGARSLRRPVCLDVLESRLERRPRTWGLALPTDPLLSQNLPQGF